LSDLTHVYLDLVGSVILLSVVFYLFELRAPAQSYQPLSKRVFNLIYASLYLAATLFLLQPLVSPIISRIFLLVGIGWLFNSVSISSTLANELWFAVVYVICVDLWQYWLHRLQHRIPFLWATHRFHHSETALNATSQARHHLLQVPLVIIANLPVLILLGARPPHYLVLILISRVWGFVNHANLRIGFSFLTPFVSGPQWHRIHHSILPQHQDKNFATFLPFIDVIFGTYYRPSRDEFPPPGLLGEAEPNTLREATIAPFAAWYRTSVKVLSALDRRQRSLD